MKWHPDKNQGKNCAHAVRPKRIIDKLITSTFAQSLFHAETFTYPHTSEIFAVMTADKVEEATKKFKVSFPS